MRLTELCIGEKDEVLMDAAFENFGLLNSKSIDNILSYLDNETFLGQLDNDKIKCIICKKEYVGRLPDHIKGIIISETPMLLFWKLHNQATNFVMANATEIGSNCKISPMAYVAPTNVIIGNNVTIEEFVSIKENTYIGDNVTIRAGSIVGGSGLEAKRMEDDILSVNHYGSVVIEDGVEIQQLVSIEKSVFSWDQTIIGASTKLADMVLVSHGGKVGKNCLMAAKSMLCGSVHVKDNVWIGPGVIVKNGLTIGNDVYIAMGSVVRNSIEDYMAVVNDKSMPISKFNEICSNLRG